MNRFSPRWVALWISALIAVYLCWMMIQPFLDVVLWAGVMAIIAYPLNVRLRRRFGPATSAALTTTIVVLTVVIPLTFVAVSVVGEAGKAAHMLQHALKTYASPDSAVVQKIRHYIDIDPFLSPDFLPEKLKTLGAAVVSRTVGIVGGALGAMVQIFFALFTLYYLLRDSERIMQTLRNWLPLSAPQATAIFERTQQVISASVNGVLVISAIQGALGGIGFLVLGVSSPILWGVVMFFMSMIPMAGAFVVWVPAAIFLLATGHWIKAVLLTIWGVGVIGMIDNVLRPRLVGEKTQLHELVVLFSVLGGLQVFGILGLIVGPVVVALTLGVLHVLREMSDDEPAPAEGAVPGR